MVLMLALVPVLVTLIYVLVLPFTVRFLVARRGTDDVVVTDGAPRVLTHFTKELLELS